MATIDAARALGIDKLTGSIEVGKKADIILVDMFKPHLVPFFMASHRIAYEALGSDVNTVIVDGKVLMENREVKTVDEKEVLEQAQLEAEETIERGGLEPLMKMEQREEFWRLSKF
jgi:cytosine/adenosine deaminase-related metal-dependent hydrolase